MAARTLQRLFANLSALARHPSLRAVIAGNVALALMGGATGVVLARSMTTDDRGMLAISLLWPGLATILFSLGLREAVVYWWANGTMDREQIVATAMSGALGSSLLLVSSGTLWIPLTAPEVDQGTVAMWIVVISAPFGFMAGVIDGVAQACDIRLWSRIRLIPGSIYLVLLVAAALLFASIGPVVGASAYSIGVLAHLILSVLVVPKGMLPSRLFGWNTAMAKGLYRYGARATISSAAQTLNARLDLAVLAFFVPTEQVGIYVVAVGITQVMQSVLGALGPIVFPRIAANPESGHILARRALLGTLIASSSTATVVIVTSPLIIRVLVGAKWLDAVPLVRILSVGIVFLALRSVLVGVLQGYHKPLWAAGSDSMAAVVTLSMLVALVPQFGTTGAAVASVAAYFTAAALMYAGIRRPPAAEFVGSD